MGVWMEKSILTETSEEQSQECAHHRGDFSQRICPGRPYGQFCILLWCFTMTEWKCEKTSRWTWWQKNWLLHHNNASSHTCFFTREFFTKKWLSSPTHHSGLAWLLQLFSFPDWRYHRSVVVKALCYKPEGRGFETRLGVWFCQLPNPSGRTGPWGLLSL
jgi:hypothetical protein